MSPFHKSAGGGCHCTIMDEELLPLPLNKSSSHWQHTTKIWFSFLRPLDTREETRLFSLIVLAWWSYIAVPNRSNRSFINMNRRDWDLLMQKIGIETKDPRSQKRHTEDCGHRYTVSNIIRIQFDHTIFSTNLLHLGEQPKLPSRNYSKYWLPLEVVEAL